MKRQWFTWKGFLEILTHPFIIFAFVFTILFLVVMPIVTVHENQKKYQENVTPSHTIPYHYPTGAQTEQPDASVTLETDAPDETAAENEVDSPVMLESDVPDKAESAVTDTDAVLVNGENNSEVMSFADVQNDAALVGSWEYDEAASKNCENAGYRADVITTFDANGMLYYVNTETYTWTATADTLLIFGEFGRGDMDELEATCSYTISGDTLTLYLNDMIIVFHRSAADEKSGSGSMNSADLYGFWKYDEEASENCEDAGYSSDVITTFGDDGSLYFVNTETYSWTATADTLLIFGEGHRGDMDHLEATCSYTISGDTLKLYLDDMMIVFHRY